MQLSADAGLVWPVWLAGVRAATPLDGIGLLPRLLQVLLVAAADPNLLVGPVAMGRRMRGMGLVCEVGLLI